MSDQRLKPYLQPAFLVCAIVLFIAAAGMSATTAFLKVKFIKLPLPLRSSLDLINKGAIKPYKVVNESKIENKDIREALGTDEYVQWIIEDETVDKSSPTRFCSLFITFYTGTPDQVPHVPEECYTGGGRLQQQLPHDVAINVALNGKKVIVPVRTLRFADPQAPVSASPKEDVSYFFKVNGKYAASREPARRVLQANFFSKYSYFSKVEWKFFNRTSSTYVYPDESELAQASQKLLSRVLPVLENDHWPDWDKANQEKN